MLDLTGVCRNRAWSEGAFCLMRSQLNRGVRPITFGIVVIIRVSRKE